MERAEAENAEIDGDDEGEDDDGLKFDGENGKWMTLLKEITTFF